MLVTIVTRTTTIQSNTLKLLPTKFENLLKKQNFQNEACKRFLQITVLMTLQPASRLDPPHLRGLRGKRGGEARLTGTTD